MNRGLAALLCALALAAPAQAGTRRALVLGANEGLPRELPLEYAESDARALAEALVETGAVEMGAVHVVTGPDVAQAERALAQLRQSAAQEDVLFVFYSGHAGADGLHLDGQVWPWPRLREQLGQLTPTLLVAFVDACHSGALLTAKGLSFGPPLTLWAAPLGPKGRLLITSSGANESAYESRALRGSPFAQALVSGLRGAADFDGDAAVTLGELYRHLYERTVAATVAAPSGPQRPAQSVVLEGSGDWVLVRRGAQPSLSRGREGARPCYVLDRRELRVLAELGGRPGSVFLPPGEYRVKCPQEGALEVATVALSVGDVPLESLRFTRTGLTPAVARGEGAPPLHALTAALGGGYSTEGGAQGGLWLRYTSARGDALFGAQGFALAPALTVGAAATAGVRFPWWSAGATRLELGLALGGAWERRTGGGSLVLGQFTELSAPLAETLSLRVRLDVLTALRLFPAAPPSTSVLLSAGAAFEL